MQETIHLSDLWEHTITKIFKHDPESELGIMIRQWVIYNKLEDFNSLLKYTDEDLIPHGVGSLSFYKENDDSVVKLMSPTPLQELINLRWYIQHLIHESGYLYDDDESNYPLSEDKWMLQTHGKFMKYVFYILHRMAPEQMKKNPIKPIIKVKTNEKLDTDVGESNSDEQESTISNKEEEEYSTFSHMSKENSESDINVHDNQDEQNSHQKHCKFIIHTTQQCMINIIQYMMNMTHQKLKIQLKLKHLNNIGRKFKKQKSQYLWNHLKFLLYSTKQYIMKMIHQMTNL